MAAKSGDQNALLPAFGTDGKDLISSGYAVQGKAAVDGFVAAMHRWRNTVDGTQVLLVGADNFPFPIPLNTLGSLSAMLASRAICIGSWPEVSLGVGWSRWRHLVGGFSLPLIRRSTVT